VKDLDDVLEELVDRFGPLPVPARNLLAATHLRLLGTSLRLYRVQYKNERLFLFFPTEEEDPVFYESTFEPLLKRFDLVDRKVVLKQGSKRVRAIVQRVPELRTAIDVMHQLGASADAAQRAPGSDEKDPETALSSQDN
jgi:transcription-repair coupling factor (superfamily II helicase)